MMSLAKVVVVVVGLVGLVLPSVQAHGFHDCEAPFEHLTNDLCVHVINSPLTCQEARTACKNGDSYLAILNRDDAFNELDRYLKFTGNTKNLWVGASSQNGVWEWDGGIPLSSNSPRWLQYHPLVTTSTRCAFLAPDNEGQVKLQDVPTDEVTSGAVCFRDYHEHHKK